MCQLALAEKGFDRFREAREAVVLFRSYPAVAPAVHEPAEVVPCLFAPLPRREYRGTWRNLHFEVPAPQLGSLPGGKAQIFRGVLSVGAATTSHHIQFDAVQLKY